MLIKSGVLKRGDLIVSGSSYGKMRVLLNDKTETIKDAEPGTPVEVLGFNAAPAPGELFEFSPSEKEARQLVEKNEIKNNQDLNQIKQVSLKPYHNKSMVKLRS